jgi:hypothetical protein
MDLGEMGCKDVNWIELALYPVVNFGIGSVDSYP